MFAKEDEGFQEFYDRLLAKSNTMQSIQMSESKKTTRKDDPSKGSREGESKGKDKKGRGHNNMSNVRCWNCGKPFCSNGALLLRVTEGSFSGCSFLRPSEPWPLMPRKGWSTLEVPDGWLQVIRGPRPPAVRWPTALRGRGRDRPQNSNRKEANKGSSQAPQVPVPEVRRGHHKSLQLLRSELCVYSRQWTHWEPRCCASF